MAEESFEPYHIPQQSRRDKLRLLAQNQQALVEESSPNLPPVCAGLLPLYDPSLISSDLLTCANQLSSNKEACKTNSGSILMGFSSSSSSVSHQTYLDPGTIQILNNNNNPFLFPNNPSYNGSEIMVFKPEPLSLSLSSSHQTNLPPLELNLQRYGSAIFSTSASNDVGLRSSVPLGPFTGYASVMKGSRFLKPAQQLLEELCDIGGRGIYAEKITAADTSLMEPPSESLSFDDQPPLGEGGEGRKKKSRLLTMLDEVYRRYRQYYQQMQAVITSFEYIAGLGNAAPYATLAIKVISKHFKSLKNVITEQLQFTNQAQFQMSNKKDESPRFGNIDKGIYRPRPGQSAEFLVRQPVWRPQRGLPERAVSVLRAWLFEHFLHPYPTDTDKLMLAKQTGLSRSQVSNWFINARVRLWKPMVEEIHTLETRQAQKNSQREEHNSEDPDLVSKNPSTSIDIPQDSPHKRTRNTEAADHIPVRSDHHQEQQLNLEYASNNINQQPMGSVNGVSLGVPNNGVSLTLGLHQNHNGVALSELFPLSTAQSFGLAPEPSSNNKEGFVMSGSEVHQNRHFGRDHVIGGQLLRDFVG